MNQSELSLVSDCSAAKLAQKSCKEARQLSLRLETSHRGLIIRTHAQWIPRPKRTKVDGDFYLSGEGARHPVRKQINQRSN